MRLAAAIDIGGTRTKLGIIGEDGAIAVRATIQTSPKGEPQPLLNDIAAALQPMLETHQVLGVGVSVAGFLDSEHDAMFGNANLPALCGFPLRRAVEERLALSCRLEVDSNASTVAEHRFGAGQGSARLLGVTIGTGVGGGVIVQGKLLRHTGECAGDIGHVIVSPSGRLCACGAKGCLEAMVCSAALSERAGGKPVREIVTGARQRQPLCLSALAETGRWLGLGLASLSPLFAPDRIVVGGGVAAAGDLLLEPARASYQEHAAAELKYTVPIVGSLFGGWEGIVGAASLFLMPEKTA